MSYQWQKRINSAVTVTSSSASSGNLSSSTNVGTIAKKNKCNKNENKGAIADKLDSNSRKKNAKQFKAIEGKIINLSNFPKHLLRTEEYFKVAGPGSSSRRCGYVYCSYLHSTKENIRTKLEWKEFVKQTHWICTICQAELCKGHFDSIRNCEILK